jgi:hypothetical protein
MDFTISANPSNIPHARHLIAEYLESRLKEQEYVYDVIALVGEILTDCMDTTPPHVSLLEIGMHRTECGIIMKIDSPHPLNVRPWMDSGKAYGVKADVESHTVRLFFPYVVSKSLLHKAN